MQFEYTGRHMDVTPAIRAHVEEHFGKLDHIFENSSTARAHVIIDVIKNRHNAEIILHWREHTLTAKETNADMYGALTRAIDKLEKQALKLKKKIIERKQSATPLSALAPQDTPRAAGSDGGGGGGRRRARAAAHHLGAALPRQADDAGGGRDVARRGLQPVRRLPRLGHQPPERALQAQGRQLRADPALTAGN